MSNYVKQTWVDGNPSNPVSAARMGVIEQGIFDAHFQPAARAFHNAAQAITSGITTVLAFNSERFDTDTIHDTVTNNSRLTCKTAGKYQITGCVELSASPASCSLTIRLNGATIIAGQSFNATTAAQTLSTTTLYDMAVNDYVELCFIQTSGGSINVNSSANYSPEFMMSRQA